MIYAVYDKTTKAVLKTGITSPEDCGRQIDDPATQAVVAGDTQDELEEAAEWVGVTL